MGKWDRRWIPRRRYNSKKYRDYDYEEPPPSPPSPHHPQSNPPPIQDSSGLSWEIDFCKSVRVPWKKVVAAKHYMYCYENVAKWDDSAGEEAFHDAKRRYWEKINCFPNETPLPDKDTYIDKINWNLDIDPKLIAELDQEYFNPDEVEKSSTLRTTIKMGNYVKPDCAPVQNNGNPDGETTNSVNSNDATNPWEQTCTLVDKSLSSIVWKGSEDESPAQEAGTCCVQNVKSIDVGNPWERSHSLSDESLRNNAWKGTACGDPAQGVRTDWTQNAKSGDSKDVTNPWEQSLTQFDESSMTNAWKSDAGMDPLQGVGTQWSQHAKSINLKAVSNPWGQSLTQFDDPLKNNAWKGSAGEGPPQRVRTHWGGKADSKQSKDVNPWEQSCTAVDESLWSGASKGCPEESWLRRKGSTHKRWSADDNKNARGKGWVRVDDRSRGRKQWNISSHEQQYTFNTGNTWERSFPSDPGVSWSSRGWIEYGNKSRGWKQPESQNKQPKNTNYKGPFAERSGWRKREGSLQHSSRYKTSRFQGDDYVTVQK